MQEWPDSERSFVVSYASSSQAGAVVPSLRAALPGVPGIEPGPPSFVEVGIMSAVLGFVVVLDGLVISTAEMVGYCCGCGVAEVPVFHVLII
jgi:hypothetical protein